MGDPGEWSMGIEEEYLLFDVEGGGLSNASAAVRGALGEGVDPELLASQVEVATGVHATIDSARAELTALRTRLSAAAEGEGSRLVAAGCHPTAVWRDQQVTAKERYEDLAERGGRVARETVVCGLHVHVGIEDPEQRIRALVGARRWLGPLLALSASSPFWEGSDTGFSSFRTPIFRRWPNTGVPGAFSDFDDFTGLVDALTRAGSIEDGTNLYWDMRPSVRFPTVEVRVADACPRLDDTLVLAALVRGVLRQVLTGGSAEAGPPMRTEVLEAAVRHAARHGLGSTLLHPLTGRPARATEVVHALLDWCRPALEAAGDVALVEEGVASILATGGAAARLRAAYGQRGSFDDVVALLVEETAAG